MAIRETGSVYARFSPFVRTTLARLGIRPADLPDVCHDVFIVVHRRAGGASIEQLEPWLYAICRRVAAGYRRRSFRRCELLVADPGAEDFAAGASADVSDERLVQRLVIRGAFAGLSERELELVALRHVDQVPIGELAQRLLRDRKTIRKHLRLAVGRVTSRLERADATVRAGSPLSTAAGLPGA